MGLAYIEEDELLELRFAKATLNAMLGSLQPEIERIVDRQARGTQPDGRAVLELFQQALKVGFDAGIEEVAKCL